MNAAQTKRLRKSREPSRPYIFAVTAIAVFLGLLAWQHPRGSETVAEAKLKFSRHENPGGAPVLVKDQFAAVLKEMKTTAFMTESTADLEPSWLSENLPITKRDKGGTVTERLADRLFFRFEPASSAGHVDVSIRFMGGSDAFALRLLEEVTGRFEQMHSNGAAADDAARAVAAAEKEVNRLATRISELEVQQQEYIEEEVAAARDRHEAQLQVESTLAFPPINPEIINPVSSESEPESVDVAAASRGNLPIVEELNPEWTRLREYLQDLESELVELHQQVTPAHPDFRRVQSEKDEVAAQLAETPQFISSQTVAIYSHPEPAPSAIEATEESAVVEPELDPEPVVMPAPVAAQPAPFDEQEVRAQVADSAIGQRLAQQIASATADLAKQRQLKEELGANQPQFRETTVLVGPPRVIRRYSEPLTRAQLWIAMGISIFAGTVVSCLRTKPELPDTLFSVSDVEKSLELRSVGGVTTPDGPSVATPTPARVPWFAKGLVHGSEVVLTAAIVIVGFTVVSVPGFGAQFLENPFSAFAFAFDQISSFLV